MSEMMQNKHLLASLARLDQNPDFVRFREIYLDCLLDEVVERCIEDEKPARHQGAAQIIKRIQSDLAEAEEAYYKIAEQGEIPIA
jgi:hypothetical protein